MRDCGICCSPFVYIAISLHKKAPPQFAEELFYTKHQLKTIQKIEHNLAYMDYAMIFFYSFIGD